MSDTYIIKLSKKNHWSITKFSDYKEPDSTYEVSERGGNYYCSCPGFHRQKNKAEHKHIIAVKHWRERLNSEEGVAVWFENETIKSNKFLHHNSKLKQILTCS